ncbi:MAG: hypothetical protein J5858_15495 [Lentisphaeria bacterium]|nr:hypothetical protein [Lentisphaeria bacterium]
MNFYQKMYGVISLLIVGITAMLIFIFIEPPYSQIFKIQTTAILWAELLVGLCVVFNVRKNDSLMLHTAGYTVIAILYLVFTLVMICFASSDILPARFLTVHITGFAVAVILMILFFITEHNFVEQEQREKTIQVQKQDLRMRMEEIAAEAGIAFAGDRDLLQSARRLADDARFLADPSAANTSKDEEIISVMDAMKQAAVSKDRTAFTEKMERLGMLFRIREKRV